MKKDGTFIIIYSIDKYITEKSHFDQLSMRIETFTQDFTHSGF